MTDEDADAHITRMHSQYYANLYAYPRAGFFICSANIRLDKFSGNTARLMVGIDNDKDVRTGLGVVKGSDRCHGQTCRRIVE